MKQMRCTIALMTAGLFATGCSNERGVTGPSEINLAGCEVPEGIDRQTAEAITCSPSALSQENQLAPDDSEVRVSDTDVIDAAIVADASETDATEHRDARQLREGVLTGEGGEGIAVFYTLEGHGGGNNYSSHLAGFVRDAGGQLHFRSTTTVTGLGSSVESFDLRQGTVVFKLLTPGPDDATCCPSVEEDVAYVLHGNAWLQVQTPF
ncbi:MAG: hypothetical protein ABW163_03590 [Luteimonas sp.]